MQFLYAASYVVTHIDSLEISQSKSDGTDEDVASVSSTSTSTSTSATPPATEMCKLCLLVPSDCVSLVPCTATPVSVLHVQVRLEEWEMGVP